MELFRYFTCLSPSSKLGKLHSSSRYFSLSTLLSIALIIAITLPHHGSASNLWPTLHVNSGQIESIISDERDDSVFIVVKDNIYKYDEQLKLLTSTETTSGKISNAALQSNMTNKFLHIVKLNNVNLLLSCWLTPYQILNCWANKLNDLRLGTTLKWKANKDRFSLNLSDKILTLGGIPDHGSVLMVTNSSTDKSSNDNPSLPNISKFEIVKYNASDGTKLLFLEQKSVLLYQLNFEEQVSSYVYLFIHEQYIYFILNDIRKPTDLSVNNENQHDVKISRMCTKDNNFTSYTEVSLTCNDEKNLWAKSAFLFPSGSDSILYVVYEEVIDSTTNKFSKSNGKSFVCSYSMSLIDDYISKAVTDCHDGFQTSNLLKKFNAQQFPCHKSPSSNINQCESKANPFIDGSSYRYNIKEDSYIALNGITSVSFIHGTKQGPEMKRVFFIGTEYGLLTKMNFDDEDLFYSINLNNLHVKDYQLGDKSKLKNSPLFPESLSQRGAKYSVSNRAIYTVSNDSQTIGRIDMDACYYYKSCISCLSIRDPLKCVWCGNKCSLKSECDPELQMTETCPPIIKDFQPKYGPITGYTKLLVEGENFGSGKGVLNVKLGNQDCSSSLKLLGNGYLECITQPVEVPTDARIDLNVSDESSFIFFKGSVSSSMPFSYVEVKAFGLIPHSGPSYKETKINIIGKNLDAGSNRSVFIGETECEILESRGDNISCSLKAIKTPLVESQNSLTTVGKLKIIVDGSEQILDPSSYIGPLNLSTTFIFNHNLPVLNESTTMTTIEQPLMPESENLLTTLLFIGVLLVFITFIVIFLLRSDKISNFKLKMSTVFESKESKSDDTKVSFRNPQSHKFSNAGSAFGSESINGLVRLNGSVMSSDYFCKPEQLEQDQPLMNNFLDNELIALLMQEKILIDRNRLTLGHVLGSGQFGRVYKGFLKVDETGEHAAVAVKTLHSRSSWDDASDNRAFLEEGLMMKDFEHDNVLALIGVTFDANGLPMVITPFMLYGDLRSYISDEASSPTVKELIDFGTQVARGMAYLSGLKFVHRDLAARNCMLDDNLVVKVADFGLSRDIYERDYYSSDNKKAKLPVKWMAIESLEKCIYNTKTDVWSYGILLWELMTRGVVPYPDVDNFDLFSYLKEGRRMLRPRYCPVILYKIMLSCWEENAARRPTFVQLVKEVSDVITQLRIAKDGQQKVSRDVTYCDVLK